MKPWRLPLALNTTQMGIPLALDTTQMGTSLTLHTTQMRCRTGTVPVGMTPKRALAPRTLHRSLLLKPCRRPTRTQALPVVVASLRLMCRSPACVAAAWRSGSFCHVQQSLLSDAHRHERAYLEDTKGALDVLAERLAIRFVEGSEKVRGGACRSLGS